MTNDVTAQVYATPRETCEEVQGTALVHSLGILTCRTPWPEAVCRCGYYVLVWAITPEDLAAVREELAAVREEPHA